MNEKLKHAVTGAFGFTGKYIATELINRGREVITLTRSIERKNAFGNKIEAYAHEFEESGKLVEILSNVEVLYNTYWVRFNYKNFNFKDAILKNEILFKCAREAGVRRVIHVSVTNASLDSDLEYFRGKAECERMLKEGGLSYAIVRPAIIFGKEDILINNIAWMIRKLPVIGVFGDGQYKLQPIYVKDLAKFAVAIADSNENVTVDAIGPETFTFRRLLETMQKIMGTKKPIVSISPAIGYWSLKILGKLVGDVILTKEEIKGLMDDLLHVNSDPVGKIKLTDWLNKNRDSIGMRYAPEIKRRTDVKTAYDDLSQWQWP